MRVGTRWVWLASMVGGQSAEASRTVAGTSKHFNARK